MEGASATLRVVARFFVATALVVILFGLSAPAALADTLCDSRYGSYCCNQTVGLRLVMTYKSQWYSERDYDAYRLRSDGTKKYNHFQPVSSQGVSPYWSFTNSVDALRQTAQQRGGSSSASWQMWEWALGSCG
jgi:hypothetical protein